MIEAKAFGKTSQHIMLGCHGPVQIYEGELPGETIRAINKCVDIGASKLVTVGYDDRDPEHKWYIMAAEV